MQKYSFVSLHQKYVENEVKTSAMMKRSSSSACEHLQLTANLSVSPLSIQSQPVNGDYHAPITLPSLSSIKYLQSAVFQQHSARLHHVKQFDFLNAMQ